MHSFQQMFSTNLAGPSTEPQSVLGDCQYDNPGHTDATTLGHDATQLQAMKLEMR